MQGECDPGQEKDTSRGSLTAHTSGCEEQALRAKQQLSVSGGSLTAHASGCEEPGCRREKRGETKKEDENSRGSLTARTSGCEEQDCGGKEGQAGEINAGEN